jgi:hypothetical protein
MSRTGSLNNFQDIEQELASLEFSDSSIVEFLYLLNRAIEIATEKNPVRRTNHCLNNLLQTREKQTAELLQDGLTEDIKRERFIDAKAAFRLDFGFCRRLID